MEKSLEYFLMFNEQERVTLNNECECCLKIFQYNLCSYQMGICSTCPPQAHLLRDQRRQLQEKGVMIMLVEVMWVSPFPPQEMFSV